jgi:hypothetical protein
VLLGLPLLAERNRICPAETEQQLSGDQDYPSLLIATPI